MALVCMTHPENLGRVDIFRNIGKIYDTPDSFGRAVVRYTGASWWPWEICVGCRDYGVC